MERIYRTTVTLSLLGKHLHKNQTHVFTRKKIGLRSSVSHKMQVSSIQQSYLCLSTLKRFWL